MPAPNGTIWGDVVRGDTDGRQGKLGIYIKKTETATKVDVNIQVWFATIYSCSDGDGVYDGWYQNKFSYYNGPSQNESLENKGEFSIQHKVNTGSAWNTNNQTPLLDKNYSYPRGETAVTHYVRAQFEGIDMLLNKTVYSKSGISYTIPALQKYTITYSANQKTLTDPDSLPSPQTKYHGQTITLSNKEPKTTGYNFDGWRLPGETFNRAPGSIYDRDGSYTIYAQWVAKSYTILYDKNAPDAVAGSRTSDIQTYGSPLKLPQEAVPTRTNYNFLGWSTSSTAAEPTYKPGDSYQPNEAVRLYAVWELAYIKPSITNLRIERCDKDGIPDDEGKYCNVSFSWKLLNGFNNARIRVSVSYSDFTKIDGTQEDVTATSGEVVATALGKNLLDGESSYVVWIMVTDLDATVHTEIKKTLPPIAYPIDVLAGGKGIAFGKPAKKPGVMDIGFTVDLGNSRLAGLGDVLSLESGTDLNTVTEPGVYSIPSSDVFLSLVNYPTKCTAYRAGRLEVWTSHGAYTDSTSANHHIMQRFTNQNATSIWTRYMKYTQSTGEWTVERDWENDALRAYPVGSIYMSYNSTDPGNLFGGTWKLIAGRFLYATSDLSQIGGEGPVSTSTADTSAHYVKIAAWQRTA